MDGIDQLLNHKNIALRTSAIAEFATSHYPCMLIGATCASLLRVLILPTGSAPSGFYCAIAAAESIRHYSTRFLFFSKFVCSSTKRIEVVYGRVPTTSRHCRSLKPTWIQKNFQPSAANLVSLEVTDEPASQWSTTCAVMNVLRSYQHSTDKYSESFYEKFKTKFALLLKRCDQALLAQNDCHLPFQRCRKGLQ